MKHGSFHNLFITVAPERVDAIATQHTNFCYCSGQLTLRSSVLLGYTESIMEEPGT
jgi:hypothetical protein